MQVDFCRFLSTQLTFNYKLRSTTKIISIMSVTATLTNSTDTRVSIGRQTLLTSASDHEKAASPMDVLSASVASCVATVIGVVASDVGVDVTGLTVDVEKTMQQRPTRVKSLSITVKCPVALSAAQRKALESAAKRCPVKQSLHPDITVEMNFI